MSQLIYVAQDAATFCTRFDLSNKALEEVRQLRDLFLRQLEISHILSPEQAAAIHRRRYPTPDTITTLKTLTDVQLSLSLISSSFINQVAVVSASSRGNRGGAVTRITCRNSSTNGIVHSASLLSRHVTNLLTESSGYNTHDSQASQTEDKKDRKHSNSGTAFISGFNQSLINSSYLFYDVSVLSLASIIVHAFSNQNSSMIRFEKQKGSSKSKIKVVINNFITLKATSQLQILICRRLAMEFNRQFSLILQRHKRGGSHSQTFSAADREEERRDDMLKSLLLSAYKLLLGNAP